MIYWRLAAMVTLSSYFAIAALLSLMAGLTAPRIADIARRWPARRRARAFLALRLGPSAVASAAAFGVALPLFLYFEPHNTDEPLALTLLALAAAGGTLIVRGIRRAVASWRATAALERRWRASARAVERAMVDMPVFAVPDEFPTVAVVGLRAPRLYVSERLLASCPDAEIDAMLAHEAAHVVGRDNLTRALMRLSPDLLWNAPAIESAWSNAAEELADAAASGASATRRLDLAQALVRVARLAVPESAPPTVTAFYLGGSIEDRIRALLGPIDSPRPAGPFGCLMTGLLGLGCVATLVALAPSIHQAMEAAVRVLP